MPFLIPWRAESNLRPSSSKSERDLWQKEEEEKEANRSQQTRTPNFPNRRIPKLRGIGRQFRIRIMNIPNRPPRRSMKLYLKIKYRGKERELKVPPRVVSRNARL